MKRQINVHSEIGKLKTVLLHRPGHEIENLTPDYLERLLFDDIPFLKVAREEHDRFEEILRTHGVEVLYIEKLAAEALKEEAVKEQFLKEAITEAGVTDAAVAKELHDYFNAMAEKELVDKFIAGVRKKEVGIKESFEEYPFIMDPMPNVLFTRDPFATMGSGVTLNHMMSVTRNRETLLGKYVFNYHPDFKDSEIPMLYDRKEETRIEGGDELILSRDVLAIGVSQRTAKESILKVAKNVFESGQTFKTILMFHIPATRAFMHLDTVFTMVDYDKFTIHPAIEGPLVVEAVTWDEKNKELIVKEESDCLEKILEKYLGREVKLIRCGGGDIIISGREQWNDGSNTLAIAPGTVVTYERNYVSNELLDKHNITVLTMPSAELSRGRGGPRCMSMPLFREEI